MLDSSMASYLSEDALLNEDETDMVDLYLNIKEADAYNRGYKLSYLQFLPLNMKAKVVKEEESSAQVEFSAVTIRSINPLFRIVGFIFGLIEENEVKEILTVVKENGEWKIGPGAFDLPRPI